MEIELSMLHDQTVGHETAGTETVNRGEGATERPYAARSNGRDDHDLVARDSGRATRSAPAGAQTAGLRRVEGHC